MIFESASCGSVPAMVQRECGRENGDGSSGGAAACVMPRRELKEPNRPTRVNVPSMAQGKNRIMCLSWIDCLRASTRRKGEGDRPRANRQGSGDWESDRSKLSSTLVGCTARASSDASWRGPACGRLPGRLGFASWLIAPLRLENT